jgi:putative toxin-antitoxin system antitoxin component (TIGR02293 family)
MRIYSLNLNTKTTDQMIAHLKQGLSTDTFDQLRQRLNISDNALSKIVQIPKRTLDRRRTAGRLNTDESERIFRIAQVNDMAVEVFGCIRIFPKLKPERHNRWRSIHDCPIGFSEAAR